MKLLLRSDVEGVGRRGDLVEVADGYGRNYLVPRGLAVNATPGVEAQAERMRRSRQQQDSRDREAAQEIASRLVATPIEVRANAGSEGRLFGSVTTSEVAAALAEQAGVTVDRKQIVMEDHIKELGSYSIVLRLHADVQFPVTLEVVAG